jgi:tetratricopeptide (TPR) repeat protein
MRRTLTLALLTLASVASFAQELTALHMFLPDRKGALEIKMPPGYQVAGGGLRPDGKQFTIQAKGPNGVYMTAFVEIAPHSGTNAQVRDEWYGGMKKNSKMKMDEEKLLESNGAAIAEYTVHEFQGVRAEQRSLHAYYGGDEIWSEVHISKVAFTPRDEKIFDDFLSGVKSLPDYVLNARDEFGVGSTFYEKQDYKAAALHYQKALDLEKQKPMFDQTLSRVLIDQLGMSYGISGDLAKSKEVLEYGISKDPGYPMFYYNIACGYGEQNDQANAVAFLKKAFERKKNLIKGERMPDPLTDDSFRNFVSDPSFVSEVKAMQK